MIDGLYEDIPCYLVTFAEVGPITRANPYLLRHLGYTGEEIRDKKFENILTPGSRLLFQTHFLPIILLQEGAEEVHLTLRAKGGEDIPVLMNMRVEKTDVGNLIHAMGMRIMQRAKFEKELRDAKKKAEDTVLQNEELQRIGRMLEQHQLELDKRHTAMEQRNMELIQLNEIISHDLQEPIRKISVMIDKYITDRDGDLSEPDTDYLRRIMDICSRMRNLLLNLQTYGSITSDMPVTAVDISHIFDQLRYAYADQISALSASIVVTGLPPAIDGNYDLYYILFKNLLENSLNFHDPMKTELLIDITATVIEENLYRHTEGKYKYVQYVRISFRDNGIGFDNSQARRMFALFRKATLDRSYVGVGVGLALAKKITDLNHGTITAESNPGTGSTFIITLPLSHQL